MMTLWSACRHSIYLGCYEVTLVEVELTSLPLFSVSRAHTSTLLPWSASAFSVQESKLKAK